MSAVILTTIIAVIQFILGAMGVYVSLRPPNQSQHKWWIGAFAVVGILGIFATGWLAHSADVAQEQLKGKLDQSLLSGQYMRGQIDSIGAMISRIGESKADPQLTQLAVSIGDMVKASQKQAEDVRATSKDLSTRAANLAKQIRAFESDYDEKEQLTDQQYWEQEVGAATKEQQHMIANQQNVQRIKTYQNHDSEFRNKYFGDAKYLKDLILQRLPPDQASTLRSANGQAESNLEFGMMAGAFNENGIAAYLEELSKALAH